VVATLGIGGFGRVELVKVSFSLESFVFHYKVQKLHNFKSSVSRPSIQHICPEVFKEATHCRNPATGTCFLREEYHDVLQEHVHHKVSMRVKPLGGHIFQMMIVTLIKHIIDS
jgi:hypothetical protein